jgi:hypothetical protein
MTRSARSSYASCRDPADRDGRSEMSVASPFLDVDPAELERAPTNHVVGTTLLLENDRVRVWDITLAPGERTPFHCHRTTYFYRCESGGRWRLRTLEGEVIDGDDRPGWPREVGPRRTSARAALRPSSSPARGAAWAVAHGVARCQRDLLRR